MAWAPSGRWLALGGWVDLGLGHLQTSFRILEPDKPTSFQQFPVNSGEAINFILDRGP
jgi:hypothetical protein